jgi:hypothetical protein
MEVIEHHLKIFPDARLVQQKPRKQSIERQNFIRGEIKKMLDDGFIREVHHPRWLANLFVISKAGGKLWMCIDYTNINKACSKDPFSLSRIDQIVDSTSGCNLLCFLDAYSGFHQIPMCKEDEEHTTFIVVDGLFCYVSMPYGLKNAIPTFVHDIHKIFSDLIRDLVEVYVHSSSFNLLNTSLVFVLIHFLGMISCYLGCNSWTMSNWRAGARSESLTRHVSIKKATPST